MTRSQASNLLFCMENIWQDFSENCCNQGPWKSGADTSIRKTAWNTLVNSSVSNLEANFTLQLLVCSPDLRDTQSHEAQWEITITLAWNQSKAWKSPYGMNPGLSGGMRHTLAVPTNQGCSLSHSWWAKPAAHLSSMVWFFKKISCVSIF